MTTPKTAVATPWHIEVERDKHPYYSIQGKNGEPVCDVCITGKSLEYANHLVHCVNSHEVLINMLKELLVEYKHIVQSEFGAEELNQNILVDKAEKFLKHESEALK